MNVVTGTNTQLSAPIMRAMHEFRHEVFVRRLGWMLPLMNGVEQDEFDTADARYVVACDASERVTGCARLLPTTKRYMLPELFPQLLGGKPEPKDPTSWELSRFAASVRETREGRVLSLSKPTLDLLGRVMDCARDCGAERLVLVTTIGIERLMLRAGVGSHRIGPPAPVDGSLCVALYIEVPQTSETVPALHV